MKTIINKYSEILHKASYEVINTQKLGWIIVRTDYRQYSNPIIQIETPEKLEKYILSQIECEE